MFQAYKTLKKLRPTSVRNLYKKLASKKFYPFEEWEEIHIKNDHQAIYTCNDGSKILIDTKQNALALKGGLLQ